MLCVDVVDARNCNINTRRWLTSAGQSLVKRTEFTKIYHLTTPQHFITTLQKAAYHLSDDFGWTSAGERWPKLPTQCRCIDARWGSVFVPDATVGNGEQNRNCVLHQLAAV
jgi:hypothetical protein